VQREMAEKVQGDPETALQSLIGECPLISEYLNDAKRATDGAYGRLRVRKDYSYHGTKFWRPGMVVIGDAARSINGALAHIADEQAAFSEFELRYRREFGIFYTFLASFYNLHANEDSYFWSAKKITKSTATELEAFVELVGGVASGEAALVGAGPLARFNSVLVQQVMQEMKNLQSLAERGEILEAQAPLGPRRLVSSPDGLFWVAP
jgi:FAD-dependent halogenase